MRKKLLKLLPALGVVVAAAACTGQPVLPSTTVSTLSISGAAPGVGTTAQFVADATFPTSAAVQDVTALATWSVSDQTIATVSTRGVVTGVKVGSTTITATYNGSTVSEQISIHS